MAVANMMAPAAAQAPVAATDAVATLAADANSAWHLEGLMWSYSAAPAALSRIEITWGSTTITLYVAAGGPGFLNFAGAPMNFPKNTAVTITLKSGGGTVVGTIYPIAHRR